MQRFTKAERISIQREIDLLFSEGKSFTAYPLRVVYVERKPVSEIPVSVLISVSKKRFKRAVKRNRIKRLIRETYRLNKSTLWESLASSGKDLLVAFIYIGNEVCDFEKMEEAMKKVINSF
ncbi:ribonuclease P protein component [Bacteroidia bacterium]|nr:ribonuclease P protein component [Bacteroidia bacterium]